jgi:hypothetical protein
MPSERVQRHIDRLLGEADQAAEERAWPLVRERAHEVLTLDPDNADGQVLLALAERGLGGSGGKVAVEGASTPHTEELTPGPFTSFDKFRMSAERETKVPTSFASGRYTVKKFLGEADAMNRAPTPGGDARREEALHHLDFAIGEFGAMKMQPALERALRHKDMLTA